MLLRSVASSCFVWVRHCYCLIGKLDRKIPTLPLTVDIVAVVCHLMIYVGYSCYICWAQDCLTECPLLQIINLIFIKQIYLIRGLYGQSFWLLNCVG
jgi:hypothetical protein